MDSTRNVATTQADVFVGLEVVAHLIDVSGGRVDDTSDVVPLSKLVGDSLQLVVQLEFNSAVIYDYFELRPSIVNHTHRRGSSCFNTNNTYDYVFDINF